MGKHTLPKKFFFPVQNRRTLKNRLSRHFRRLMRQESARVGVPVRDRYRYT